MISYDCCQLLYIIKHFKCPAYYYIKPTINPLFRNAVLKVKCYRAIINDNNPFLSYCLLLLYLSLFVFMYSTLVNSCFKSTS